MQEVCAQIFVHFCIFKTETQPNFLHHPTKKPAAAGVVATVRFDSLPFLPFHLHGITCYSYSCNPQRLKLGQTNSV